MSNADIAAVVLAAGRSSRMGESKAALRLPGGQTFLHRIVTELIAGGAGSVIAVVAPHDAAMCSSPASASPGPVRYVVNPDPDRGQLSSLQCGLALTADAPAVLVTLVDVPLVSGALVGALIEAWARSGAPLVRLRRAGEHGHPMLVSQPLIGELLAAEPSSTARAIVRSHASEGVELDVREDGPFFDVDTPEEYRRLIESLTLDRRR